MKRSLEFLFIFFSLILITLCVFHGLNLSGMNTSKLMNNNDEWTAFTITRSVDGTLLNLFGNKYYVKSSNIIDKLRSDFQ